MRVLIHLALLGAVAAGVYLFVDRQSAIDSALKFDAESWKSNSLDQTGVRMRQRMLFDLRRNILPSLSRLEVKDILGEPFDVKVDSSGSETYCYHLGMERGWSNWPNWTFSKVRSEWLKIVFDHEGRVKKSFVKVKSAAFLR